MVDPVYDVSKPLSALQFLAASFNVLRVLRALHAIVIAHVPLGLLVGENLRRPHVRLGLSLTLTAQRLARWLLVA